MKITVRLSGTLIKIKIREAETWGQLCRRLIETRIPRPKLRRLLMRLRPRGATCHRLRYGDFSSTIIFANRSAGEAFNAFRAPDADPVEVNANVFFSQPRGKKYWMTISPQTKADRQLAEEKIEEIAVDLCVERVGDDIGNGSFSRNLFPVDDGRTSILQLGGDKSSCAVEKVVSVENIFLDKTEMKRGEKEEKKKKKKKKRKKEVEKDPLTDDEIRELSELINRPWGELRQKALDIIEGALHDTGENDIQLYIYRLDIKPQRKLLDLARKNANEVEEMSPKEQVDHTDSGASEKIDSAADVGPLDVEGDSSTMWNPMHREEMNEAFSIEHIFADHIAKEDYESGKRQQIGLAAAVVTPSTKHKEKGIEELNLWQSSPSLDSEDQS